MGDAAEESATGANVRVAVRARPLNARERSLDCTECVEMVNPTTTVIKDSKGAPKEFVFDYSYWHDVPQQKVYDDLAKPIVEAAIDGFNGVIFAYGQTGSGKTHSMMGSGDDVGIVPLMNQDLFGLLEAKKKSEGSEFLVTASYMEIYNEVIRDLLNPSDKQLKIREHPKLGIYVESLAELVVENSEDIAQLLEQGNNVKQVAATQMNERSSRSHCCFVINIKQRKVETIGSGGEEMTQETNLAAKINLVDLAGSERAAKTGAEGSRLKEGAAINQSLSTLGQVINMLAEGASGHIPYRNSKLTRVLQQALGGNAKTVMIATISPADNNYQETLSTLQYASRAKKIKNTSVRNEDVSQRMIRELREEVERLRAAVQAGDGVMSPGGTTNEETIKMQETIAMLEDTKKRQWEEVQALSKAFEEERSKILKNETQVRSIMQNVKEEKLQVLRRQQELEREKVLLSKALRQTKSGYDQTKSKLEKCMTEYQTLETSGESEKAQTVLAEIEAARDALLQDRASIQNIKEQLRENQTNLLEAKAEIEAQRTVLEGDSDLRKAIMEEERSKLELEIDDRRHELLKEAANKIEGRAADQIQHIEQSFQRKLNVQIQMREKIAAKAHCLEMECMKLKLDNEMLREEVERLRGQCSKQEEAHEQDRKQWQATSQKTVKELIEAFKNDQARVLEALRVASEDCVKLAGNSIPGGGKTPDHDQVAKTLEKEFEASV